MKMPAWPVGRHSRGKGNGAASGQSLRLHGVYLRGRYNGGALQCGSNRRNDARHYRLVYRDLLDFAGLSSNLAYITSVFIGYIGTDSIGSLIKRFAAKNGVEDGRNQ